MTDPLEQAGDPQVGDPDAHDPAGLGLARSMAQSVRRQSKRRRDASRAAPRRTSAREARSDDRDPQLLGAALEHLVDAKGWSTEVSVHTVLGRWVALVGPEVAQHARPESYADAVLTVRTDSTAWASELRLMAPQLVAIFNESLGEGTVAKVVVRGPDAPSWKKGRLSVRDGRGPRDTYG